MTMEEVAAEKGDAKKSLGFADKQFIFIGVILLVLMVIVYFSVISGGA